MLSTTKKLTSNISKKLTSLPEKNPLAKYLCSSFFSSQFHFRQYKKNNILLLSDNILLLSDIILQLSENIRQYFIHTRQTQKMVHKETGLYGTITHFSITVNFLLQVDNILIICPLSVINKVVYVLT